MLNTKNLGYLAQLKRLAAMSNPKREVNHHETKKTSKQRDSDRNGR